MLLYVRPFLLFSLISIPMKVSVSLLVIGQCFARRDLPEQHRIIEPGKAYTADFVERR